MGLCFALISLGALKSIALPILGLGVVIFVHELGHFLVAKACGVKCEKFYVGFDVPISLGPIRLPSALFRKQWGETEYGIGIIPLGGYVKMLGQDDNPANAAREAERAKVTEGSQQKVDPRSYTAKSVPQRMAIISAGVIMNLIFAVIFATVAYLIGVKYIPCVIGKAIPGEPAWMAGIQPGDQILQFGRDGKPDPQLRFIKDLRPRVAFTGSGQALELLVRRKTGEQEWLVVTPNQSMADRMGGLPTIGILAGSSNEFGVMSESMAERLPDFADQDRITAVMVDGQTYPVSVGWELEQVLARYPEKTLQLQVERLLDNGERQPVDVTLAPRPFQMVGLLMEVPSIGAVRPGSPADRAGLRAGDTILEIAGEPFEDPLLLDQQLLPLAGQEISCRIRRPDGTELTLALVPDTPEVIRTPSSFALGTVGSDTIGVAFPPTDQVAGVRPGSPAERAGMQAGDVLTAVAFEVGDPDSSEGGSSGAPSQPGGAELEAPPSQAVFDRDLSFETDYMTWPFAFQAIQTKQPGEQVKLSFLRDGKPQQEVLAIAELEGVFNPDRGLPLVGIEKTRTASSLGEAVQLGVRETREGVSQVVQFLQKIGRLYKSIGGPIMIFAQAKQETSQGVANLLTFLTMLSANLAVLNILPIPVLDGGHLVFLTYEGVTGRPANERIVMALTMLGLSFLLGLMVWVFGMDIYRVFLA